VTDTSATVPRAQGARTRDDAIVAAAEIAARLPERWAETEALRRVPDATLADLRDAGLLRINQPARFGGVELGIEAAFDVCVALAGGDVAIAWAYALLASHEWIVGLFPASAQDDVWGDDPELLVASSFAPSQATVERVDDGWRLAGRWPWSSGSDHASWVMLGFRTPPEQPGAPGPVRWALVPCTDYRVDDDWHAIAVQGTGSNTVVVADAVVPDHRVIDPMLAVLGMAPGAEVNPTPLFRVPFTGLSIYLAGPVLGGARAASRHLADYISTKTHLWTGEVIGRQDPMLGHVGEVEARVSSAEAVLRAGARNLDATAGQPVDPVGALALVRDTAFAVRLCADAVDEAMRWSGASAVREGHRANKWWRDVRALSAHQGFNTDSAYVGWARAALGLPPLPGPFA
jgi:3-hydroxy-9,10-secoandrosta-1,3,5(10)-triene-9,17-dione monooxygenase